MHLPTTGGTGMPGSEEFSARIRELAVTIGFGTLTGRVEVDQVYAHRQHEDVLLKHPRGGGAFYLTRPLTEHMRSYLERIADSVLEEGGPVVGMIEVVEDLSDQVRQNAPFEFGFLQDSGHPSVVDDGMIVYDRPPIAPRLTHEEIKELNRLRGHD
jgi:hypothetical protein